MEGLNIDIHNEVYLVPWKEEWAHAFHREKQCIIGAMIGNGHSGSVRHVGSTSIKGMVAKPIIDILVCPDDGIPLEDVIPDLEWIGYKNLGEGGRPGRYFMSRGDQPNETFYVHLCHESHPVAQDQLLFQRIERENPIICRKYIRMKLLLADMFPEDREMYRALKGLFIEGVLSAYRQAAGEEHKEDRHRQGGE